MAGDWIKMRCNLWTHPKVVTLSLRLSVTRAHVIGALHGAWSVADQHGACVDMSPESLDALVETPGFTTQLVSVAWLSTDDGKLQFLNYEEHNGATAKARALTHKRVTASRNRNGSVTQQRNKSVTREEKIREEKNKGDKSPLNPLAVELPFNSQQFLSAWQAWVSHRSEKRKPLTPTSLKQQLKDLGDMGEERALSAIRHSIANGYQGIFEPNVKRQVTGKDYSIAQLSEEP